MAQSPTHRFGQIIGDILESAIRPLLEAIATEHGLFLDCKRAREARDGKKKVVWVDGKGNAHDLDYVLESGGTDEVVGTPKAFVEIAWRRYTKHSRNKAQEIQGAIGPLAERYSDACPFLGVILAGVFTDGSLSQLRSHGFTVVYFPYESVVEAFATVGIDAWFDEETPDTVVEKKVRKFDTLGIGQHRRIGALLCRRHRADLDAFASTLRATLIRKIESVYVFPLHGIRKMLGSVTDAIAFIESFDENNPHGIFARYEVGVRYSNGDEVRGQFERKPIAIAFLRGLK